LNPAAWLIRQQINVYQPRFRLPPAVWTSADIVKGVGSEPEANAMTGCDALTQAPVLTR